MVSRVRLVLSSAMMLWMMILAGWVMAVAEPDFEQLVQDGDFELRRYPGFIVAETYATGDFDSASRAGFRRIAAYIFGDNQNAAGESSKIAMTAPVTVEASPPGTAIEPSSMPLTVQADADRWRVHFVMPSDYALQDLPSPDDSSVSLREVGEHRMAIVQFSGFTTRASVQEQTDRLNQWIIQQDLSAVAAPQVARYNDPFTLPWRRRNEIMVEVK